MKFLTLILGSVLLLTPRLNSQVSSWALPGDYAAIAVDAGGMLYASGIKGVSKIDSSGQVIWNKSYGVPVSQITTAVDKSVYIAGLFSAALQLGSFTLQPEGPRNIFIARLDPAGAVQWAGQISSYANSIRIENLQMATDSRSAVYLSAVVHNPYPSPNPILFFQKYSSSGTSRHTRSYSISPAPYTYRSINTVSVDSQDNLHVVYETGCNPPPGDLQPHFAESRSWYDSAGTPMGFDCDLKASLRERFTGYKAGNSPSDYLYTKLQLTTTGVGTTFLNQCFSESDPCYNAPAVNPDRDKFGNVYYAGHQETSFSFHCRYGGTPTLRFSCTKNRITNPWPDTDIYAVFGDSLVSTKDHGSTIERAYAIAADPNGRSLYILGEWSPGIGNSFQFGNTTLQQPGRMILRYRVQRKQVTVDAGPDLKVCAGDTVTIGTAVVISGGTAPYSFEWSPATSLSDHKISTPVAQPETTTDYVLTVTDAKGSFGTDTVRVSVADPVLVNIPDSKALPAGVLPNTVYTGYAPASKITLHAVAVGGSAPLQYYWSQGGTTPSVTVQPAQPTSYTVTVTDQNGCSATASKMIAVVQVSCGNKSDKVQVNHKAGGKGNHLLCISPDAVPDHLLHGDYLGNIAGLQEGYTNKLLPSRSMIQANPNPSANYFTIHFSMAAGQPVQLRILNADGRVMETFHNLPSTGMIRFGSRYQPGIYFAQMKQGSEITTRKLVKTAN